MAQVLDQSDIQTRYDPYRFGDGSEPVLQPGTIGWTAGDFEDRTLRRLWDQGRYEIINGVLTAMPAAFFGGGSCVVKLIVACEAYFKKRGIPAVSSTEVDIQVLDDRLLRADGVVIFGEDLPRFKALKFTNGRSWAKNNLILPPTLVIESVSEGHEAHDRKSKRAWYAGFGVPRYWIVDSLTRRLECYRLVDGGYADDGHGRDSDRVVVESLPGLKIVLAKIWAD